MNPEQKVGLDQSSKKYPCPKCGVKRFVPYMVQATGSAVDEAKYGRCDRENECGYHLHPYKDEAFKDELPQPVKKNITIQQIFPDKTLIEKNTQGSSSNFHLFCKKNNISLDHLKKWGVFEQGGKTVFVFRDIKQRVVNFKYFKYRSNGHRDKDFQSFSLKQPPLPPPKKKDGLEFFTQQKYKLCFFGEHLLSEDKSKVVCMVESEKTAVIASAKYPEFDWLSCASNNGVTDDKISVLHNREVYWLCDNDAAGRENNSIERLKAYINNFHVVDLFPAKEFAKGYDIADSIIDGLRFEIVPTQSFENEYKMADDASNYSLPKGCKFDTVKDMIYKYSMFFYKNRTYRINYLPNDKGAVSKEIAKFAIDPLGLIRSVHFPRRLIKVTNFKNHTEVLEIPTKAFVSNTEFSVFVESVGNFPWNGSISDLKLLRMYLYDKMFDYEEVDSLGWHRAGYFIFANGVYNGKFKPIDDLGFVKMDKKNFFIEPLSSIHKHSQEDFEDEKKFIYKKREDVTFEKWAKLFIEVHKDNGMITMSWFMASLFRDFIYKQFKFFPHLFLFGPPGTGKSQMGWSVRSMGFCGIKKPFNLSGGTQVAFYREFSHFTNFPCWFDEYDNSIDYQRVQSLKAAYDGAGHKKSVKDSDKRTKTVPVNSSCMISGQQLPVADNALFKRVILLQFHQMEFSSQEDEKFKDLQNMEADGLTFITAGIINYRKHLIENFDAEFDKILEQFTKLINRDNVESRIVRNMVIPLTVFKILEGKIKAKLPFNYTKLQEVAINRVREQMSLIQGGAEANVFWDMVSFLIDQGFVDEEVDYIIETKYNQTFTLNGESVDRKFEGGKQLLFLKTSRIFPLYREHFKRQNSSNASPMDKGSLIHYLEHQKYYLGNHRSFRFKKAKSDDHRNSVTSCFIFDYELMKSFGIEFTTLDTSPQISAEGHEQFKPKKDERPLPF